MPELLTCIRALHRSGALDLPMPGRGSTPQRHRALFEFGRTDLSLARLAEAHTDALAILAEAARRPIENALYGVWAADNPQSVLTLLRTGSGSYRANGIKLYCTGAGILDASLITARLDGRIALLHLKLDRDGLSVGPTQWAATAFARTNTASMQFVDVAVVEEDIVGLPDWYLTRPGFWHGALGPAACWAGGAAGLVDAARNLKRTDPHSRAQTGALEAIEWGLMSLLTQAGKEIDADPQDHGVAARRRALMARHLIERLCTDALDRFGRATGPQLLAFDSAVAQRHAELSLYIRQCHGERDLASIPTDHTGSD